MAWREVASGQGRRLREVYNDAVLPRSVLFGVACLCASASCGPPPPKAPAPAPAPDHDPYARALHDAANAGRADHKQTPAATSAAGDVEVLLYSPAVADHGIRRGGDAERDDLIHRAFPGAALACSPETTGLPYTETRGLADGPFSAPARDERLVVFLNYPTCGGLRPAPGVQELVLFDARRQVTARKPLGDEDMLYAADDFFGEGRRSFVVINDRGRGDAERMVARLLRFDGADLVVVAESLPMRLGCSEPTAAPAFVAVLRPGGAREYRTVRPEGTCR